MKRIVGIVLLSLFYIGLFAWLSSIVGWMEALKVAIIMIGMAGIFGFCLWLIASDEK